MSTWMPELKMTSSRFQRHWTLAVAEQMRIDSVNMIANPTVHSGLRLLKALFPAHAGDSKPASQNILLMASVSPEVCRPTLLARLFRPRTKTQALQSEAPVYKSPHRRPLGGQIIKPQNLAHKAP